MELLLDRSTELNVGELVCSCGVVLVLEVVVFFRTLEALAVGAIFSVGWVGGLCISCKARGRGERTKDFQKAYYILRRQGDESQKSHGHLQ